MELPMRLELTCIGVLVNIQKFILHLILMALYRTSKLLNVTKATSWKHTCM